MALLHDEAVRTTIEARLDRLRPDTRPRWGKMSVDQMLWHVNQALETDLGRIEAPFEKSFMPRPVLKFIVLNMPWPKGAPTNHAWVSSSNHDFQTERSRCRQLMRDLAGKLLDESWPVHPNFGRMSGRDVSRLHAKHLDHHLKQFGA